MGKTINNRLPHDHIIFNATKIRLGSSIAGFFIRRGFSRVILEYDYKSKSLEIIGLLPEQRQKYHYPITEGLSLSSTQPFKLKGNFTWSFFIESTAHLGIIDFSRRYLQFKARAISEDRVLIEDLPIIPILKPGNILIDIEHAKVICHSTMTNEEKIRRNLLDKSIGKNNTEKLIEKMRTKKITNPSNIIQDEIKIPEQKIPGRAKDNTIKETDPFLDFKNPQENSLSQEALEKADKEYSKVILGE